MNNLLIAGLAGILVLSGAAGYAATNFEKPSYGIKDKGDWGKVSKETINIESTLWINNPNPVGLSVGFVDLGYSAEANNMTLAEGNLKGVGLSEGNNTKTLKTSLNTGKIPDFWASHLKNNETSEISVPVTVKTPVKSFSTVAFTKEIETDLTKKIQENLNSIEGTYEGPGIERSRNGFTVEVRPELEITEIEASWGEIKQDETEINLDFSIYNPNAYAVPVPSFEGNSTLNNITVADWNANAVPVTDLAEEGTIAPGETEKVRFKIGLNNEKMDGWLRSHVKREEYTEAEINAHMIFEFNEQKYDVPAGGLKCRFNVQTAILVDNETMDFNDKGCERQAGSYPASSSEEDSDTQNSTSYSEDDLQDLNRTELLN